MGPGNEEGLALGAWAKSASGAKEGKFVVFWHGKKVPNQHAPQAEKGPESRVVKFPVVIGTEGAAEHVYHGVAGAGKMYCLQHDVVLEAPVLQEDGLGRERGGNRSPPCLLM